LPKIWRAPWESGRNLVLVDTWYGRELGAVTAFDDALLEYPRVVSRLAIRTGWLRGIALFLLSARYTVVVTTSAAPGARLCALLFGLAGIRKLVLLEFIAAPIGSSSRLKVWRSLIERRVVGTLLRRALLGAHVLTEFERTRYAEEFNIPERLFSCIHWPSRYDDNPLPAIVNGGTVLASGRRTDWVTFFEAAVGADWRTRVVCTAQDREIVERCSSNLQVTIRCDITASEHAREVKGAAVYVIPLAETAGSVGQVRLMDAAQAGTPVVVSRVSGVSEYVDETCAMIVSPGNSRELFGAVYRLLSDAALRERLRVAAHKRGYTMKTYLEMVGEYVQMLSRSQKEFAAGRRQVRRRG